MKYRRCRRNHQAPLVYRHSLCEVRRSRLGPSSGSKCCELHRHLSKCKRQTLLFAWACCLRSSCTERLDSCAFWTCWFFRRVTCGYRARLSPSAWEVVDSRSNRRRFRSRVHWIEQLRVSLGIDRGRSCRHSEVSRECQTWLPVMLFPTSVLQLAAGWNFARRRTRPLQQA